MEPFDQQSVADEAGIAPAHLARIADRVRQEFLEDRMLCELHILRACRAIRDLEVTVEQFLGESTPTKQ